MSLKYPSVGGGSARPATGVAVLARRLECAHGAAHITHDWLRMAGDCRGSKKVRLVWPGYLWSRNSATDTRCHPMMDQWKRSRSDGVQGRTGHLIATQVLRKTNFNGQAMCLAVEPRTGFCWACLFVSFSLIHTWKNHFVHSEPRALTSSLFCWTESELTVILVTGSKTNLTPDG